MTNLRVNKRRKSSGVGGQILTRSYYQNEMTHEVEKGKNKRSAIRKGYRLAPKAFLHLASKPGKGITCRCF